MVLWVVSVARFHTESIGEMDGRAEEDHDQEDVQQLERTHPSAQSCCRIWGSKATNERGVLDVSFGAESTLLNGWKPGRPGGYGSGDGP